MSIKSVAGVFIVTVLGLLGIFYVFVSPENLPMAQTLTFVVVGVGVAVLMGFFVAAACAYMAGLVGTSSSPISGIGILGIIVASLVMYALCSSFGIFSLPGGEKFATATAIFTTSIILAIACISNDNMQDLKTGYLVGATPWRQQVALLLGCIVGALVIAPVLNLLYEAYGFPGALPRPDMDPSLALAAPQAALMTTIAQGIFSSQLAWEYIYLGIGLGVVLVIVDQVLKRNTRNLCLPPLAVGMGICGLTALMTGRYHIFRDPFAQAVVKYKVFPDKLRLQPLLFDLLCIINDPALQVEDILKSFVEHIGGSFLTADTAGAIHDDVLIFMLPHHIHRHG